MRKSWHGFSVPTLIADGIAFFVIRDNGLPVGCAGIKLSGDYGETRLR
jgi:hypothetical protein